MGRGRSKCPSYTISHYKLSFWAAASALWALAAAVRARPPYGRARPSPLHIKKALASKWYYHSLVLHPPTPYTLSPLLKGGEGRGEGGADTHVPCPFGAFLMTLYYFKSKAFLM